MKFFAMAVLASANAIQIKDVVYHDGAADLAAQVQGLQWCPDFDDYHTLKDGHTAAIPWPKNGYNCKEFHEVLGPNAHPYSQNGPKEWN